MLFDSIKEAILDAKSNLNIYETPPENPKEGEMYYNSFFDDVFIYVGGNWQSLFLDYREFNDAIIPADGWSVDDNSKFTASNEYGDWSGEVNQSVALKKFYGLFDNDIDTGILETFSSASDVLEVTIDINKKIRPNVFEVCTNDQIKNCYIYGYDEETSTWETITEEIPSSYYSTKYITSKTDKWYKKFKISANRRSSSYNSPGFYTFQITSGTIILNKEEYFEKMIEKLESAIVALGGVE